MPFRILAKEAGCALVCSEMISANGLVYQSKNTTQLLDSMPEEKPLAVQIFGSDPTIMAEAAKIVESSGADILDINFGCPVKKIIKSGSGVALMQSPEKAEDILKNVRKSIKIPLTIKIRSGWNPDGKQALKIAEIAEACGVDAITVHPRTAKQGFVGYADWTLINTIKRRAKIPIFGNGDIVSAEDAMKMLNQTGCDGVMIGRAAIGRPWIFSQVNSLLKGENLSPIDLSLHSDAMLRYLRTSVTYLGEKQACYRMRSRLGWFVKGLNYSSQFRNAIKQISSETEAVGIIKGYMNAIKSDSDN